MKEVKSNRGQRVFHLDVRRCDRAVLYTVGVVLHPMVVRHARSLSCFDPRKSLNCLWCIVCVQVHIDLLQSTRFPCDYAVCALHCGMVDTISCSFSASMMCCKVLIIVTSASFIIACVEHRQMITAVTQVFGGQFQRKSPMAIGENQSLCLF
jgi:hypothetical protein